MGAGAEGAAGIDRHRQQPFAGRLPGWPEPELADLDRAVEGAPAVLPAGLDRLGSDLTEGRLQRSLGLLVAVDGQLQLAWQIPLLEAVRRELEQLRSRLLRPLERNANGDAKQIDQRNTDLRRSKRLSSCS